MNMCRTDTEWVRNGVGTGTVLMEWELKAFSLMHFLFGYSTSEQQLHSTLKSKELNPHFAVNRKKEIMNCRQ